MMAEIKKRIFEGTVRHHLGFPESTIHSKADYSVYERGGRFFLNVDNIVTVFKGSKPARERMEWLEDQIRQRVRERHGIGETAGEEFRHHVVDKRPLLQRLRGYFAEWRRKRRSG